VSVFQDSIINDAVCIHLQFESAKVHKKSLAPACPIVLEFLLQQELSESKFPKFQNEYLNL